MGLIGWVKLLGLALVQDSLIFKPKAKNIKRIEEPNNYNFLGNVESIFLTTADNIRLNIWHKKPDGNNPTFVVFHGNTGNWGDVGAPEEGEEYKRDYRIILLKEIEKAGYGFIAVSMRGYGKSGGKPSEEGFEEDLSALVDYLKQAKIIDNLIILGESLGASIAFMLSQQLTEIGNPPKIIATISAFSTMVGRIRQEHPDIAAKNLNRFLKHKFDSTAIIPKLDKSSKIYIAHGADDSATLPYHSQMLADTARENGFDVTFKKMQNTEHINWKAKAVIKDITKLLC